MRIDHILAAKDEPVFSFEFFPPKTEEGERNLHGALEELATLEPDFTSVTYGAGGSTRDRTLDIVTGNKRDYAIGAMAPFSGVGATADERRQTIARTRAAGVETAPARRGAAPAGETEWKPTEGGLSY